MATSVYRPVGDVSRFCQEAPVKDLTLVPFGFQVGTGGIEAANNLNPPQVYATDGGDNQEYVLNVPKGNPDKCWVFITAEQDIEAAVADYSTVSSGTLTIDLHSAPLASTMIRGVICYGRNAGEGTGAIASALSPAHKLASTGHDDVCSLLRRLIVEPIGWTTGAANAITETRGPNGVTVTGAGSGVYNITFDHQAPHFLEDNWSCMFSASDGRRGTFSFTAGTDGRTTVTVTFENATDMADGDRASVLLMGPEGEYSQNYGGTAGGVYSDLVSRDVNMYSNYKAWSILRRPTIIPVHCDIPSGTGGPAATSNLPPGLRIERASAGVYTIYIGAFEESDIITLFNQDTGVAVGVTAIDGDAGTLTVTAVGGDPAGTTVLNGLIFARLCGEV